jgi:sn-glycerol 3-phosphate transport system substrate-binding protein
MLPSTPELQLASWLFLKFLVAPESAMMWSSGSGYFNPIPSTAVMMTEENFGNPELFPYFDAGNQLLNNPDVTLYSSPSISAYAVVRNLIGEAIANVTSNGMSVEEAAQTLQEQADQALADSM